jgi:Tfp pilus assembly protein PilF
MIYLRNCFAALLAIAVLGTSGCAQLKSFSDSDEQQSAETVALEQERARELASLERAVAFHKSGDIERAQQEYQNMLAEFPGSSSARVNLALIELNFASDDASIDAGTESEKLAVAKGYIEDALRLDPNNVQALTIAGVIARKEGRFEDSEQNYRQALSINDKYLPAVKNLAILLDLYRGELAEALSLYEQAQSLSADPDPKLKDWIFDLKRRIGEA